MVSIVLPYVHSRWNDTEIKYALRSVEKHLTNYSDLFIIGDKPKGLKGYIHIPYPNAHDRVWKEKNIYEKVMLACNDDRVSENFLYMNDDHFLNSDYDAAEFPYYYGDWPVKTDMYKETMENTKEAWNEMGIYDKNYFYFYDVHAPMIFTKENFKWCMDAVDWENKAGYCMKSLYSNFNGKVPIVNETHEYYPDLKLKVQYPAWEFMQLIKNRLWFSTDDSMRDNSMEALLKHLYPVPSQWEA